MAENMHTAEELRMLQSLPLEAKITYAMTRIRGWYEHWQGNVYVSFSGGKDSTVLKHIVDSMYSDVPSVFVNTGLEYPEIQRFVREVKEGKYSCFNPNVQILRPEIWFDDVVKKYGYPVISKKVANTIELARPGNTRWESMHGTSTMPNGKKSIFNFEKYCYLLDAPFKISDQCCHEMKKKPMKKYNKLTGRKPIIGMLAEESQKREIAWRKTGCNAFELKEPQSQPLSIWTEQDILHYIKKYNVPYCPVYGEIVEKLPENELDGQMTISDYVGYDGVKLKTTGCTRTGCMFCMFGVHLEKEPNRFQQMKQTHPRQWDYCMNELGLKQVLDYIGVKYE